MVTCHLLPERNLPWRFLVVGFSTRLLGLWALPSSGLPTVSAFCSSFFLSSAFLDAISMQCPLFHPAPHCSQPVMFSRPHTSHWSLMPLTSHLYSSWIPLLLFLPQFVISGPLPRLVSNDVSQVWRIQFAACFLLILSLTLKMRQYVLPEFHWSLLNQQHYIPKDRTLQSTLMLIKKMWYYKLKYWWEKRFTSGNIDLL
jgi:hypothetical protein